MWTSQGHIHIWNILNVKIFITNTINSHCWGEEKGLEIDSADKGDFNFMQSLWNILTF
jgi:hypothetical protein